MVKYSFWLFSFLENWKVTFPVSASLAVATVIDVPISAFSLILNPSAGRNNNVGSWSFLSITATFSTQELLCRGVPKSFATTISLYSSWIWNKAWLLRCLQQTLMSYCHALKIVLGWQNKNSFHRQILQFWEGRQVAIIINNVALEKSKRNFCHTSKTREVHNHASLSPIVGIIKENYGQITNYQW